MSASNVYIRDTPQRNALLLRRIGSYITDILHIFGACAGPRGGIGFPVGGQSGNEDVLWTGKLIDLNDNIRLFQLESTVMPYLSALADFRNSIREEARTLKATDILKLCDSLRDDILPNLGVRLEDRDGAPSAVKLVDKETLLKEREAKKLAELEKAMEKERKKAEAAAVQAVKDAQKKINPKDMFLSEVDKYSRFDENVIFATRERYAFECCFELLFLFVHIGIADTRERWQRD